MRWTASQAAEGFIKAGVLLMQWNGVLSDPASGLSNVSVQQPFAIWAKPMLVYTCFPYSSYYHVCRYQNQWLPLLASAVQDGIDISRLIPPLDIAFAWHVSLPVAVV